MAEDKLSEEQKNELDRMGAEMVIQRVINWMGGHTGPESQIGGFANGDIRRRLIDEWLMENRKR